MSAGPSLALEKSPQRLFPRHPINVPLDLIALRSGVPENLPGRCTDISETGVGAVVAGELTAGQQVALELRLPNVGVPVRARALVRYQSRFHCGLEFSGLSTEQREMIRYWVYRSTSTMPPDFAVEQAANLTVEASVLDGRSALSARRRIPIGRRGLYVLLGCLLALFALAWWQWQRSWNELESHAPAAESGLHVSPETMERRIVTKVDPKYPEAARLAGTEGRVVLDAMIAPDGGVKSLRFVSGPEVLVQSAKEAAQAWKFEPYLSNGRAVEVETMIAVEFRLN